MHSVENLRNIAVVAHIDAGKTTLCERLLYFSRNILEMGEVDDGMATMDFLEEEQKRGITIEAGVASYKWKNCRVTFIDTPGHVDFGNEVDFALAGSEGALIVISGRRGLESQTLDAWGKVRARRVRPVLFINKLDLQGLEYMPVLESIQEKFHVKPLLLTLPVYRDYKLKGVVDILNGVALFNAGDDPRKYRKADIPRDLRSTYEHYRNDLIDAATEEDSDLATEFLLGRDIGPKQLVDGLRKILEKGRHVPVYTGAALQCIGIRQVMNGINFFVPSPLLREESEVAANVLKVVFHNDFGKVSIIKLHSDVNDGLGYVQRLYKIQADSLFPIPSAQAGEIVGIQFQSKTSEPAPGVLIDKEGRIDTARGFGSVSRSVIQTRIEAFQAGDYDKVDRAMRKLMEKDPSIKLSRDRDAGSWLLSTVGEVQLEVFCERLKEECGSRISVGDPRIKYEERLKYPLKNLKNTTEIGGSRLEVELDVIPVQGGRENKVENLTDFSSDKYQEVFASVLNQVCERGIAGYGSLTGVKIVINAIKTSSTEIPLPLLNKTLMDCLTLHVKEKDIEVFEPVMKLQVTAPSEYCGPILSDLVSRNANVEKMEVRGENTMILLQIPLQRIFGYVNLLRSLSKGQGTYILVYEKHDKIMK
jgi:elongation factor G